MKKKPKFIKKLFLATNVFILLLLILVFLFTWMNKKLIRNSVNKQVFVTAYVLGYKPERLINQTHRCHGVLSAECVLELYYSTDLTYIETEKLIRQLPYENSYFSEINGYEIFTKLNLGGSVSLTINDTDGIADRKEPPYLKGFRWHLKNEKDKNVFIDFYPLSESGEIIKLDGVSFKNNIIGLYYETYKQPF